MSTPLTLHTFAFPRNDIYQPDEMYYHMSGLFGINENIVTLKRDNYLVTDTYTNAFDVDFWQTNTELKTISLKMHLTGTFKVRVWVSNNPEKSLEKLLLERSVTTEKEGEEVLVLDKFPLARVRGKLSLELLCLSQKGVYAGGEIFTEDPPVQMARIAMAVCTYKREKFIVANVKQWKRELFDDKEWKNRIDLFLVDNGATLPDFKCPNVHQCVNTNSGGAGGFSRGMIEALKDGRCTHILLMDDDITLHTEVLRRGWAMACFLKPKVVLSAAMLNYDKEMCIQHEHGAFLRENAEGHGMNCPLGVGEDTRSFRSLFLHVPKGFVYGAWWWYLCPVSAWKEENIGYAYPFFVRGDDIEFNLRLAHRGYRVALPKGLAVWHEPFFDKYSPGMEYLIVRNQLIISALYGIKYGSFHALMRHIKHLILTCHYESATVTLAGIRDYLKGPSVINTNTPTYPLTFTKVISHEKMHTLNDKVLAVEEHPDVPEKFIKKMIRILTLNGTFLPRKHDERVVALFSHRGPKIIDNYRCRSVIYIRPTVNDYYVVVGSRTQTLKLLWEAFTLLLRLKLSRKRMAKIWKTTTEFTTKDAWEAYWKVK